MFRVTEAIFLNYLEPFRSQFLAVECHHSSVFSSLLLMFRLFILASLSLDTKLSRLSKRIPEGTARSARDTRCDLRKGVVAECLPDMTLSSFDRLWFS